MSCPIKLNNSCLIKYTINLDKFTSIISKDVYNDYKITEYTIDYDSSLDDEIYQLEVYRYKKENGEKFYIVCIYGIDVYCKTFTELEIVISRFLIVSNTACHDALAMGIATRS